MLLFNRGPQDLTDSQPYPSIDLRSHTRYTHGSGHAKSPDIPLVAVQRFRKNPPPSSA